MHAALTAEYSAIFAAFLSPSKKLTKMGSKQPSKSTEDISPLLLLKKGSLAHFWLIHGISLYVMFPYFYSKTNSKCCLTQSSHALSVHIKEYNLSSSHKVKQILHVKVNLFDFWLVN